MLSLVLVYLVLVNYCGLTAARDVAQFNPSLAITFLLLTLVGNVLGLIFAVAHTRSLGE